MDLIYQLVQPPTIYWHIDLLAHLRSPETGAAGQEPGLDPLSYSAAGQEPGGWADLL